MIYIYISNLPAQLYIYIFLLMFAYAFPLDSKCLACASIECLHCFDDITTCSECRFGTYLLQGQCLDACLNNPIGMQGSHSTYYGVTGRTCLSEEKRERVFIIF